VDPKHKNLYLIAILLVASFFRLIFLDRIPTGITNDEIHFILNAKAVFYKFTDMSGRWFPLSFKTIPNETSSEIIFPLISPIIGPLPTNLFTARLPFIVVGIITVYLIYLLTLNLFKLPVLALLASLVAALNPWSIYVSRTSFDASFSIMFFLLCLLLMTSPKPKYILLSIVPGILGFYSYIGNKIIYFPLVLFSSFFICRYFQKNKYLKQYIIVTLISFLISLNFAISLIRNPIGLRTSELWTPSSPKITDQVILEKNQSLQNPLKPLLTNKYIVYSRNFIEKYLYSFSTDILFLNGDHTFMVSLWKHGYFYYIDFILIIFGIIYLFKLNPKFLYFIFILISLSPIPEAIRSDKIPAYAFHSSFQYPFFYILISAGFIFLWLQLNCRILKIFFILLYFLSVVNFVDIYFFKYPVYQPEGFNFSRRIISKFVDLESKSTKSIFVLTPEPNTFFRAYLFYTNSYTFSKFETVKQIYARSRDDISFNNIHFINDPKLLPDKQNYTLIVDSTISIPIQDGSKLAIKRLSDAGDIFYIYRGLTCQNIFMDYFVHNLNIFDLSVEKMNEKTFCNKFISRTF
jgi:hypothetical protein